MSDTPLNEADLLAYDREHIWHPYTSMQNPAAVLPVDNADGVHINLLDGRKLIDGMASWWSVIHGYNHPVLNAAASEQLGKMSHVMFGGLTHEPAVKLAKLLVEITPPSLNKVFFSDSGSVSVEVAIKMATQYWIAKGKPEKHRLIALRSGYHGDTFGAMAACDPITGMHHLFTEVLPQHLFAESPSCGFTEDCLAKDIANIKQLIIDHHHELAAVILEPVVQGAGGMKFYSPDYLKQVRALCDEYELLLICDEIATGFGRTKTLFACEHADIEPDLLCLGKSLTGGYLSFAATLCSEKISDVISSGKPGAFMHGPTFMANPLACAIAHASVTLLLSTPWQRVVSNIENQFRQGLEPIQGLAGVKETRSLGGIGVVELNQPLDNNDIATIQNSVVNDGVWLRPFGNVIYSIPPYIIKDDQIAQITKAMKNAVDALGRS